VNETKVGVAHRVCWPPTHSTEVTVKTKQLLEDVDLVAGMNAALRADHHYLPGMEFLAAPRGALRGKVSGYVLHQPERYGVTTYARIAHAYLRTHGLRA
jgi:hypothetical protein